LPVSSPLLADNPNNGGGRLLCLRPSREKDAQSRPQFHLAGQDQPHALRRQVLDLRFPLPKGTDRIAAAGDDQILSHTHCRPAILDREHHTLGAERLEDLGTHFIEENAADEPAAACPGHDANNAAKHEHRPGRNPIQFKDQYSPNFKSPVGQEAHALRGDILDPNWNGIEVGGRTAGRHLLGGVTG
jgi:hypothetical protein